ncbi:thiamine pyrophosphate-dependent dehydrogenase E1 component subunit alpha [Pseudomonas citrulli]|jgi:TPP-dependent pyruvate/acetoin dehydrogenase alpha subunit|uniref:thiamine pyrophosphate-dependent dehydrogenase E1 component subunit alpha n=1 Tax=Pseudomonas TaxID=286 RepID=UPI0006460DB7|nr:MULTISPECIES: thiamine pyrophosphate-dependent dehydrogenase E1 component subunit alpha [Pseudomonas]QDH66502.1 thiamine pyrophosphate-dependent dehydrogenase E1 component subunit alpha [Pseudomonas azotoformans]WLG54837.1 thiamine pyrophosphate-dependent dehydrogenase E1 component subunit alpha [Pseudomonas extremorientalis]
MTGAVPDSGTLVGIYQRMTRIKQNDERFRAVIKSGKLVMPYYSPRGQEVIPSAVSANLTDDDYICTIYRGVHDMIAKGIPLKDLWAELGGRVTGTCKGKGGPMHVTHPATGVMVTTGIVGSSMPIANGLALASQIRGEKRVAVAYFGDGASNIGAFHESLNLASVWKLPVVFVCQNNGYGEHTKYAYSTSVANISMRAASYSMPGITVDGNDPVAMYNCAKEAIERARNGGGPTLIEAKTFRFQGHVFGDVDGYMDKGEKDAWIAKDPVPLFRAWLIATGNASEDQLATLEATIERDIDEALEFTLSSPYPDIAELSRDIYKDEVSA